MPYVQLNTDNTVITKSYVPRPGDDWIEAPAWVAAGCTYDPESGTFAAPVPPPPTPQELKDHVTSLRAIKEQGPFTIQGYSVETDANSQVKLTSKVVAINAGLISGDVQWRMFDDVTYTLTQPDFVALANEAMAKVEATYGFSWHLKAEIDLGNITSFAEIDAATWPT